MSEKLKKKIIIVRERKKVRLKKITSSFLDQCKINTLSNSKDSIKILVMQI